MAIPLVIGCAGLAMAREEVLVAGVVLSLAVAMWVRLKIGVVIQGAGIATGGLFLTLLGSFSFVAIAFLLWFVLDAVRHGLGWGDSDRWFRRAMIAMILLAYALAAEIHKLWQFGGGTGEQPTTATHVGFHELLDGSIGVMAVGLLFLLAWFPTRRGERWALYAVVTCAAVPAAAVGSSLLTAPQAKYVHGHVIEELWGLLIPVAWLLTLGCSLRADYLEHHRAVVKSVAIDPN